MSKETNYNRNIGIQFSNDVEMGLEEAFRNNESISFALMAALAQKYNLMFIQVDGWFESRKRKVHERRIDYGRQKHNNANVPEEYAWSNTSAVNLTQQVGNALTYRQRNTTRNTLPQRSYHATNLVASYHDRRHKISQLKSPAVTSNSSSAEATQVEQKDRKRRSNYFPRETVQALFGEYRRNPILDQERTQILAQRYDMTELEVRKWFHKPWSRRRMAMPFRRNDTMNYFRAGAAKSSLNIPPNPIAGRHETAAPFTSYDETDFTASATQLAQGEINVRLLSNEFHQCDQPGPSGYGHVSRHPQEGSVESQLYSSNFNEFCEQYNQPGPSGYGNVSRHPQEGSVESQPYSSNFKEFLDRYNQPGPSGRFRRSHFSEMTGKPYPKAYFNKLEEAFVRNKYPSYKRIEKLSRETGLTIIQIRRWFYHRRRKERLGIGTSSSSSKEQVGIACQYNEGASSRSSAVEQVANVSVKLGRSNFHHSATNADKNRAYREGDKVDLSKTSGAASNSSQPLVQEVVQNISSNRSSAHHLKTRSGAGNQLSQPSTSFMVSEPSWESERGNMDETDYAEEPNIDNKSNREEPSSTSLATLPSSHHTYDSQEDENESNYDREVLQMCIDVARKRGGVTEYDNEACTSQQSGIVIHDMGLDQPIQSSGSFMLSEPSQDRERLNDSQNSTRNPQEKEENKQSKRHAPSGSSEVTYVVGSPELMGDGFTEDACYSVHKC